MSNIIIKREERSSHLAKITSFSFNPKFFIDPSCDTNHQTELRIMSLFGSILSGFSTKFANIKISSVKIISCFARPHMLMAKGSL